MDRPASLSKLHFAGATGWLNSPPLTAREHLGRAVLVNFWTYTCINWQRTLPYLRAWHAKYHPYGLTIVGVHTPEFEFEHDLGNVREAAAAAGVVWPVALDNDYAIWQAFDNHYWPALYLIDNLGRIRHHQFGEGKYNEAEDAIQRLLGKAGQSDFSHGMVEVQATGVEAPADWPNVQSAENYLGQDRTINFDKSPGGPLELNHWSVNGDWQLGDNAAVLQRSNGSLVYQFHARDLNLVIAPKRSSEVSCRVTIDGRPPGAAHGQDIRPDGHGSISSQRLYQFIRQPPPITARRFEIKFSQSGVAAYAATFG